MTTQLYTPAANTLRQLIKKAEEHNAKLHTGNHNLTWRDVYTWSKPNIVKGKKYCSQKLTRSDEKDCYFLDALEDWPGTYINPAYKVARGVDYTGYYTDSFCDNVVQSHVVSLRVKDRKTGKKSIVYLPAIDYSDWDGATVYTSSYYDEPIDAAYAADRIAERLAEDEREYNAKDQAEQQITELKQEIHEINKRTIPLIAEIKAQRAAYTLHVCQALRNTIAERMAERSSKFERISALQSDYWLAVQ